MSPNRGSRASGIVCFSGLVSLAVIVSSCGRTHASPPEVPTDTLLQFVRDYGRGHQATPTAENPAKPDETSESYNAHINSLLAQEDFAQLEKIAEQNRTGKGRLLGGVWKNYEFYSATSYPRSTGELTDADFQFQMDRVKHWVAAYPESAAARISLADLYGYYADYGRGSGTADSVMRAQWRQFQERTALAKQSLLEASRLRERDPNWYAAMQQVAHHEGWNKQQERELLDQAVVFEPGYYHFYRLHAQYLLPQWYGEPGEIQTFAKEISDRNPEPDGSIFYFQIISSLACYCRQAMLDLPNADWPKIRLGYTNLTAAYGTSNLNANRLAFMAATFKDKASAQEGFGSIASVDFGIWYAKDVFVSYRDWASTP